MSDVCHIMIRRDHDPKLGSFHFVKTVCKVALGNPFCSAWLIACFIRFDAQVLMCWRAVPEEKVDRQPELHEQSSMQFTKPSDLISGST